MIEHILTVSAATTSFRLPPAFGQLQFLWHEMSRGQHGPRALLTFTLSWLRGSRVAVAAYRCKRFWYLLLGRAHGLSFLWMWPLYWWCRQLGGRHEIRCEAEIGPGFRLIHSSMSCVVSPFLRAGKNLYLTGGNVIGSRVADAALQTGSISLGDDVMLGIGAVVIGPLSIGDSVAIGANATVVKSVPSHVTVVGGPVRHLECENTASPFPATSFS